MGPILTALGSGISAKKILEYLMRKSPNLAPKITNALASGITAEKVLGFFSRNNNLDKIQEQMEKEYPMETNANPLVQAHNIRNKNLASDMASGLQRAAPSIIGGAASLGTGLALKHALPNLLKDSIPEIQQKNLEIPQQPPLLTNQSNIQNEPIFPKTLTQQTQTIQPEVKSINIDEILNKHKSKEKVEQLLKAGNDPERISAFFQKFSEPTKKAIEKDSGMPFEDVVKDYISKKPVEPIEDILSPKGFGKILETRNGKAIIDVDGKKHQVSEKDLIKPPKEAAIEALELIKSFTPEEMRSTHHMLNSYDEDEKKGFFVFHDGSAYVVDDISPEEYEELSKEVVEAKTTGESIIGKWASGHGSRGAAYNKVVKGVRERKVVPELKKKYRKLKVGYNLLAEWQRLLNEK